MENLVKYLVTNLVNKEDEVEVSSELDGDVTVIHVTVAEDEVGKVIGKGGKIAQSLRTILRSAGSKSGKKYVLKIN